METRIKVGSLLWPSQVIRFTEKDIEAQNSLRKSTLKNEIHKLTTKKKEMKERT